MNDRDDHGEAPLASAAGRRELVRCYRDGLLQDTLPFWFPRCVDQEHGGFLHCLDRDGSLLDDDKAIWAQGRICWMLLTMYNTLSQRPEWLAWAEQGLEFLNRFGFDVDGRMVFHVARDGQAIRKRRYAYSEAFAAIAWGAHARATANPSSAARARQLFEQFVRWNFTPGTMPCKYTDTRPMIGLGPRMCALVTAQELQLNLGPDPLYQEWIDRTIDEIARWFVKPDVRAVMETVGPAGEIVDHFDGRLLNPGHAIEAAWFILREAQARGDRSLVALGCQMLDFMWERGWDAQFGGIFYFRDLDDKPVQEYWHDMKFWWPHNEAVIATLLAYRLTGEVRYARWHQQVHDWSHRHFADPKHGEWYGYLHRDGRVSVPLKGNLWKSFFHHPRMQWYCAAQLAEWPEFAGVQQRHTPP